MPGAARDSKSAERGAAVREVARVTWFDGLDGLDGGGYRFNSHSMGKLWENDDKLWDLMYVCYFQKI